MDVSVSYSFGLCDVTRSPVEHPGPRTSKSTTDGPKPSSHAEAHAGDPAHNPGQGDDRNKQAVHQLRVNENSNDDDTFQHLEFNSVTAQTMTGDASASLTLSISTEPSIVPTTTL